jgi:hypothetical protein
MTKFRLLSIAEQPDADDLEAFEASNHQRSGQ